MTDPGSHDPSDQRAEHAAAPEPSGHPAVDEVTASLDELDRLPVEQHVDVFESAHDRLRAVLSSGAPSAPTA